jgi:site-specific DNA-methyltransferase (adenine-specific)
VEINKIYCNDCLDVMSNIEDKSIDLVLTDPPYGIGINKISNRYGVDISISRKSDKKTWDNDLMPKNYFDEIFRISKNQIIFGANYYWQYFYSTKCYIIWDKRGGLPRVPFSDTELAWTSFTEEMSRKYTVINHGFIRDSKDDRVHPTQKPTELFCAIIKDFSKKDDLVFDPFCGSGTTIVACIKNNRRWLGCDISQEYVDITNRRIEDENRQLKLF